MYLIWKKKNIKASAEDKRINGEPATKNNKMKTKGGGELHTAVISNKKSG